MNINPSVNDLNGVLSENDDLKHFNVLYIYNNTLFDLANTGSSTYFITNKHVNSYQLILDNSKTLL